MVSDSAYGALWLVLIGLIALDLWESRRARGNRVALRSRVDGERSPEKIPATSGLIRRAVLPAPAEPALRAAVAAARIEAQAVRLLVSCGMPYEVDEADGPRRSRR